MSDTLIIGFFSAGVLILITAFGYTFKRISSNRDCIETEVRNFSDQLEKLESKFSGNLKEVEKSMEKFRVVVYGSLEGLKIDIVWIKASLERLERKQNSNFKIDRIRKTE